jgi:hypothetical protein
MNVQDTHNSLLDGIYALGEQLRGALETGDIDAFVELVDQRGVLVDRLHALTPPPRGDKAIAKYAEQLNQQYAAILAATAVQEKHLEAAQGTLKQVQQAKTHYRGRRERPRFLNKDLCG